MGELHELLTGMAVGFGVGVAVGVWVARCLIRQTAAIMLYDGPPQLLDVVKGDHAD